MSETKLIFEAAAAADEAAALAGKLWRRPDEPLDRETTNALFMAARRLGCAANALESLAAGNPPPKIGD